MLIQWSSQPPHLLLGLLQIFRMKAHYWLFRWFKRTRECWLLGGPAGRLCQPISPVAAHGVPAALLLGLQYPSGGLCAPPGPPHSLPRQLSGLEERGGGLGCLRHIQGERESRSGRSGREGRAASTAPGREWRKPGSCRSSRTGSCPAALPWALRRTPPGFPRLLPGPAGRRLPSRPAARWVTPRGAPRSLHLEAGNCLVAELLSSAGPCGSPGVTDGGVLPVSSQAGGGRIGGGWPWSSQQGRGDSDGIQRKWWVWGNVPKGTQDRCLYGSFLDSHLFFWQPILSSCPSCSWAHALFSERRHRICKAWQYITGAHSGTALPSKWGVVFHPKWPEADPSSVPSTA